MGDLARRALALDATIEEEQHAIRNRERAEAVRHQLIVVVALVFGGVLAWSALTEVEQVVRADGQVEPADRVKGDKSS